MIHKGPFQPCMIITIKEHVFIFLVFIWRSSDSWILCIGLASKPVFSIYTAWALCLLCLDARSPICSAERKFVLVFLLFQSIVSACQGHFESWFCLWCPDVNRSTNISNQGSPSLRGSTVPLKMQCGSWTLLIGWVFKGKYCLYLSRVQLLVLFLSSDISACFWKQVSFVFFHLSHRCLHKAFIFFNYFSTYCFTCLWHG